MQAENRELLDELHSSESSAVLSWNAKGFSVQKKMARKNISACSGYIYQLESRLSSISTVFPANDVRKEAVKKRNLNGIQDDELRKFFQENH